jgi:hypothetical protein
MLLDNVTLGELVAKNLFGNKWEKNLKYIIPRKGNFLNPSLDCNAATYAIFWLEKSIKRVTNFTIDVYNKEKEDVTTHFATLLSSVKIQFVGKDAQKWAFSTLFWDERTDVQDNFADYHAQLLPSERTIASIPFQQDGYNGEMSYLASFDVIHNVTQDEIIKYWTDPLILKGSLTVEK